MLTCLLAAATVVQFSSCSKEEDEPSLVGTWLSTSANDKLYIDSVLTWDTTYTMSGQEIVITFNADKTFVGGPIDGDKHSGTYYLDSKNLVIDEMGEIDSFTYTLNKDEFKMIMGSIHEDDMNKYSVETITYKRK